MTASSMDPPGTIITSRSGMRCEINANGSLRRLSCGDIVLNLFPGNEVEGGPASSALAKVEITVDGDQILAA